MEQKFQTTRRRFLKLSGAAMATVAASSWGLSKFKKDLCLAGLKEEKQTQDTETWKHTACAMCLMCPLQVKVKNGKIVDVKGEDIPPWNGKVCAKAYGGIWGRVYAPDRILHPLKRVGKRGEAKFVRCSWDEVINAVGDKIKEYTEAGHPEWFENWWGCPVQTDNMYFLHYFARITGTRISYMHGQICFGDHSAEKVMTFGGSHAGALMLSGADFLNMKYALIGGQNFPGNAFTPATAFGASGFYQVYLKARENGFKFGIIDPKLADSSAMADDWIPIRPGMDAALMMGITHILIKENLYDEKFLLTYTNAPQLIRLDTQTAMTDKDGKYLAWNKQKNAAEVLNKATENKDLDLGLGKTFMVDGVKCKTACGVYADMVAEYPPEKVVSLCKLPFGPEKVEEIARKLGTNKPSVIVYPGLTTGRYSNWFQVLRAYSVVNMFLGNIDQKGGFYIPKHGFKGGSGWPEPPLVPEYPNPDLKVVPAPWGNQMAIDSLDKKPCYTTPKQFHPSTQALPWEHFNAMKEGKVKALFSTAENSAITQVDTALVYECLDKLEMIVVGEQLPKEFVELADYVVPESSYIERSHLYTFTPVAEDGKEHAMALMRAPVIEPPGEAKAFGWFMKQVGVRAGYGPYFKDLDIDYKWWDRILEKAKCPVRSKDLVEKGPYVEVYPLTYNPAFKPITTRSGRFELFSNELSEECYHHPDSMWKENIYVFPFPLYIPIAGPKKEDEFYLVSGKASWHQKNATQNNRYLMEDGIEGGNPYIPLYLNTRRAEALGLKEGDLVEVTCIGPTKQDDPCVLDDSVKGYSQKVRVHLTQGLHPDTAFTFFAAGHRTKTMLKKVNQGILHSAFVPLSVEPYAGGCGKNYSLVKISKAQEAA